MQALRIKLCFLPTNFYIPHHFGIIGGVGWDWVEVLDGGVYLRLFVSIYNGASFSHQLESHFLTKCIDTRGSFEYSFTRLNQMLKDLFKQNVLSYL